MPTSAAGFRNHSRGHVLYNYSVTQFCCILSCCCCGKISPLVSFDVIYRHTMTQEISNAYFVLCMCIPLFGCSAKPLRGLCFIIRHAFASGSSNRPIRSARPRDPVPLLFDTISPPPRSPSPRHYLRGRSRLKVIVAVAFCLFLRTDFRIHFTASASLRSMPWPYK